MAGMQMNINTVETATNIAECIKICKLHHETVLDNHLQQPKESSIKEWPENIDNILQNLRPY